MVYSHKFLIYFNAYRRLSSIPLLLALSFPNKFQASKRSLLLMRLPLLQLINDIAQRTTNIKQILIILHNVRFNVWIYKE